jgi:hypothetical protein
MDLSLWETSRHWRATVEYHGSRRQQTLYLMDNGLMGGTFYWFIAHYQGRWPWEAFRDYDTAATVRMIEAGKMRLVKGKWPDTVLARLVPPPNLPKPQESPSQR